MRDFVKILLRNHIPLYQKLLVFPSFRNFRLSETLLKPVFNENSFVLNIPNNKEIIENESILQVSTFRRKKTKLKREKRNQRRKKMRNLSWKKKEQKNY